MIKTSLIADIVHVFLKDKMGYNIPEPEVDKIKDARYSSQLRLRRHLDELYVDLYKKNPKYIKFNISQEDKSIEQRFLNGPKSDNYKKFKVRAFTDYMVSLIHFYYNIMLIADALKHPDFCTAQIVNDDRNQVFIQLPKSVADLNPDAKEVRLIINSNTKAKMRKRRLRDRRSDKNGNSTKTESTE